MSPLPWWPLIGLFYRPSATVFPPPSVSLLILYDKMGPDTVFCSSPCRVPLCSALDYLLALFFWSIFYSCKPLQNDVAFCEHQVTLKQRNKLAEMPGELHLPRALRALVIVRLPIFFVAECHHLRGQSRLVLNRVCFRGRGPVLRDLKMVPINMSRSGHTSNGDILPFWGWALFVRCRKIFTILSLLRNLCNAG